MTKLDRVFEEKQYRGVRFTVELKNDGWWWKHSDWCNGGSFPSEEEACEDFKDYIDTLNTQSGIMRSFCEVL